MHVGREHLGVPEGEHHVIVSGEHHADRRLEQRGLVVEPVVHRLRVLDVPVAQRRSECRKIVGVDGPDIGRRIFLRSSWPYPLILGRFESPSSSPYPGSVAVVRRWGREHSLAGIPTRRVATITTRAGSASPRPARVCTGKPTWWMRCSRESGGRRVLDAGCGTGRVAIELAARGYAVVGVDLDAGMLGRGPHQGPGLAWVEADLADLPDLGPERRRSTSW